MAFGAVMMLPGFSIIEFDSQSYQPRYVDVCLAPAQALVLCELQPWRSDRTPHFVTTDLPFP